MKEPSHQPPREFFSEHQERDFREHLTPEERFDAIRDKIANGIRQVGTAGAINLLAHVVAKLHCEEVLSHYDMSEILRDFCTPKPRST